MATTDLGKWMITNGGDYDPDVTYEKLTMVMYDNSTYITLKIVTGVIPSDDKVNYALMARGYSTEDKINLVVIPDGEDIPVAERKANTWYLKVTDQQTISSGDETITVSPNMGIKVLHQEV